VVVSGVSSALDEAQCGKGEGRARQMAKVKGARLGVHEGTWVKGVVVAMVVLRGCWWHAH
jgi:hypothetical protein